MPRVFSAVGRNPISGDIEEVLDFIAGQRDPVSRKTIQRRFYHNLIGPQLAEVLGALVSMDYIVAIRMPNVPPTEVSYIVKG